MSTTKTKLLSSVPAVAAVGEGDKIPIVNSSGQTVLVPLSGLLSAVKVGGRNLVRESNRRVENNSYQITSYPFGSDVPQVGESLTVTIWGQLAERRTAFAAFNGSSDGNYGSVTLKPIGDGRYSGVLPIRVPPPGRILIYQTPSDESLGSSVIERIKVERGNIPTDWSPAPEDWGGG